ncbi:MAG: TonB-dependent receptor plug domain-containing protein, partial [Cyclonatronaceae bacterium]
MMKFFFRLTALFILLAAIAGIPLPGQAQDENKPTEPEMELDLESISVTASRIPMSVSESGKQVSVLTREDIATMPVTSVDELLASLPGVNINARQGFGMQANVGIRGSTFSQVLFMLDNVPLNDPLTAHFNTNIPVALSDIAQIELIRGPASAAFGADAVGGVVHIKTRSYMQRRIEATKALETGVNADISGGEHGLFDGSLQLSAERNRWRTAASVRRLRADGESLPNPGFAAGVSEEPRYDNYFELLHANAAVSYQIKDGLSAYVRAGAEQRDFSARYFYTNSSADESEEQIGSRWALAALNHRSGGHETELNLSYRHVEDTFDFLPGGIPPNEHTTRQGFLNLSHQFELSGASAENTSRLNPDRFNYIRFMLGGQYRFQDIRSTDRGDHERGLGGVYAISHLSFVNGLHLTGSARLQLHTRQAAEFLPQFSASYPLLGDRLRIRSSAGRAIRTGDFTEQYVSSQIPDLTPGRNIGNPDLRPERSYSVDAGLDWRPKPWLLLAPTAFYRSSDQLI